MFGTQILVNLLRLLFYHIFNDLLLHSCLIRYSIIVSKNKIRCHFQQLIWSKRCKVFRTEKKA